MILLQPEQIPILPQSIQTQIKVFLAAKNKKKPLLKRGSKSWVSQGENTHISLQ